MNTSQNAKRSQCIIPQKFWKRSFQQLGLTPVEHSLLQLQKFSKHLIRFFTDLYLNNLANKRNEEMKQLLCWQLKQN